MVIMVEYSSVVAVATDSYKHDVVGSTDELRLIGRIIILGMITCSEGARRPNPTDAYLKYMGSIFYKHI
jgi:hypothetical protein